MDLQQQDLLSNMNFKEESVAETGFKSYFENNIRKILEPIEKKRLEILNTIGKRKYIAFWAIYWSIAIIILLQFVLWDSLWYLWIFILFLAWIVFWVSLVFISWATTRAWKQYSLSVKDKVEVSIANYYWWFDFDSKGIINKDIITQSWILDRFDEYLSQDYLYWNYQWAKIERAQVELIWWEDKRKSSVFKWYFYLLSFSKDFECKVVLRSNFANQNPTLDKYVLKEKWFNSTTLWYPKYSKDFEVFTSNELVTWELLTEDIVDEIMELIRIFNTKKIRCAFFGKYLLITILSSRNIFKDRFVEESIVKIDDIKSFIHEFDCITRLVRLIQKK